MEINFYSRLNYLEAVLMEVQRHSNVAPLAIAHRTVRKTSLQEYIIPKVRATQSFLIVYAKHPMCYNLSNENIFFIGHVSIG